jgi:hypothetical protein
VESWSRTTYLPKIINKSVIKSHSNNSCRSIGNNFKQYPPSLLRTKPHSDYAGTPSSMSMVQ